MKETSNQIPNKNLPISTHQTLNSFLISRTKQLQLQTPIDSSIKTFRNSESNFNTLFPYCESEHEMKCDSSMNFISTCRKNQYSECIILEPELDCRRRSTMGLYQAEFGKNWMFLASFGPASKCVEFRDQYNVKSVSCVEAKCGVFGKSYTFQFQFFQSQDYFRESYYFYRNIMEANI